MVNAVILCFFRNNNFLLIQICVKQNIKNLNTLIEIYFLKNYLECKKVLYKMYKNVSF